MAIVEGHGEEEAVPILLRRIAAAVVPTADIDVLPPIPTRHQAALTEYFDLEAARRAAPSFDKLWRDVRALLVP